MRGSNGRALFERRRGKEVVLVKRWRQFVRDDVVNEVLWTELELCKRQLSLLPQRGGQPYLYKINAFELEQHSFFPALLA